MSSIVSSPLALRLAVALSNARDGRTISQLAAATDAPFSSVERALDILAADGTVERHDRSYRIVDGPRAKATVGLAVAFLPPAEVLATISRTNRAVEFCGNDADGWLMVTRRFAEVADEAALRRSLELLRVATGIRVEVMDKGALRDRLAVDELPRRRAREMLVAHGSVDRTFPDRSRHGDPSARPLGRLHPDLPTPSRRRMAALARRYHLQHVSAFGSATREDMRPDSDVDLIVEPRPGHRLTLGEIVRLNSEVEDLFGRDVDVLVGPVSPALIAEVDRSAVLLHDAGR